MELRAKAIDREVAFRLSDLQKMMNI